MTEVVKALAAERRSAGGVTSGLALTLVAVVDEKRVREAEAAATIAAAAHPCRLLIVVRSRRQPAHGQPARRRDRRRRPARPVRGGRACGCTAGSPCTPSRWSCRCSPRTCRWSTWWHEEPPEHIAYDFLGVVADRRITDSAQAMDPVAALRQRAADYAPGDTDLAWTRITPWRTLVAGAFDTVESRVTGATVVAPRARPDRRADARLAARPARASARPPSHRPSTRDCTRSS